MHANATVPEVLLDGRTWLSSLAGWGDLVVTQGPRGPFEVTFGVVFPDRDWRPPELKPGTKVEVVDNGVKIFGGRLTEPDWDAGQFAAIGYCRQAEGPIAVNATGRPTTIPNVAVDQGIARGALRDWKRTEWLVTPPSFGTASIEDDRSSSDQDDPEAVSIQEVLDTSAAAAGGDTDWYVDAGGYLYLTDATPDDAPPDWYVPAGVAKMGVADDRRIDRVFLTFPDSSTTPAGKRRLASFPASTPAGGIEWIGNVQRGMVTPAKAAAWAQAIYRKARSGMDGWTNGLTLSPGQLLTPGGQPAHFGHVRGGQKVRIQGAPDPRSGVTLPYIDFWIDTCEWRPGEGTLQVIPEGMVERNLEAIMRRVVPAGHPSLGGIERAILKKRK